MKNENRASLSSDARRETDTDASHSFVGNFLDHLNDEARLQLLSVALENLGDAVVITDAVLDPPGPKILYVNGAMMQLSGYHAEELLGKTPRMLQGPKTHKESRQAIRETLHSGKACQIEIWNHSRDGKTYLVELFITPLRDRSGKITHFVSIQRDITERHLAQIAIEDNKRRLQEETQALSRLDNATSRLWGHREMQAGLEEVLHATLEMLCAERGSVQLHDPENNQLKIVASVGMSDEFLSFYRAVSTENHSACGRAFSNKERAVVVDVEKDEAYRPYLSVARKEGFRAVQSTPLIGVDGETLGIISTHWSTPHEMSLQDTQRLDLYARQAAGFVERCRYDSIVMDREKRLAGILNTAPDAIVTINHEGVIETVNAATEEMFGYQANELVGKNVGILMPTSHREKHDSYLQRYHETQVPHVIGTGRELVARRKDGTTFPIRASIGSVPELKLFTGILEDISERVELQKQILKIAADEDQRIGQELHDNLQQQLTGLGLLARTLAEKLNTSDVAEAKMAFRLADGIQEATRQTHQLARGLVPVDIEANGLEAALNALATQVTEMSGITCGVHTVGDAKARDNTVATHLYRIAQEAINNAVKHSNATRCTIELHSNAHIFELVIRDNGQGFEIKDPNGRGFGLRIMRYRASMISAVLEIKSERETGTTIRCRLMNEHLA